MEEAEQLKSQPSELLDHPNEGKIESNQGVITQEPTPLEIFVEAAIQEETCKLEIQVIHDPN